MTKQARPAGNVYDKYASQNRIEQLLLRRFFRCVKGATANIGRSVPVNVLDVGCGERSVVERFALCPGSTNTAFDVDQGCVAQARNGVSHTRFCVADASQIPFRTDEFDLVIALEVLEHLDDPDAAIAEMARVARSHVLLSVPNEPMWRVLNYLRGAYRDSWGNTPGHVQHWTPSSFRRLLEHHLTVRGIWRPLPWTVVICECP